MAKTISSLSVRLGATVAPFTKAFKGAGNAVTSENPSPTQNEGILILSLGADRRTFMFNLLASIRRVCPEIPVHVVTDVPVDVPFTWVNPRGGFASRAFKTRLAELTPFETTLFIDDDCIVHRPFGPIDDLLGGRDIAIRVAPTKPTLRDFINNAPNRSDCNLAREVARLRPDHPYHNTGVMVFRRTPTIQRLFTVWHREWMRCQLQDQPPLVCALHECGVEVAALPPFAHHSPKWDGRSPDRRWDGAIIHLVGLKKHQATEEYHRTFALPQGAKHALYAAFAHAVGKGCCHRQHYMAIGRAIHTLSPCNLLVFGAGADSMLWAKLNAGGRTLIVEDQPQWFKTLENVPCNRLLVQYPTRRGVPAEALSPPPEIAGEQWDVVLIDGPQGNRHDSPGRELPIAWASRMSDKPMIFLHDYERPWERYCADTHGLGEPDALIAPDAKRGTLAAWTRGRIAPSAYLT